MMDSQRTGLPCQLMVGVANEMIWTVCSGNSNRRRPDKFAHKHSRTDTCNSESETRNMRTDTNRGLCANQ